MYSGGEFPREPGSRSGLPVGQDTHGQVPARGSEGCDPRAGSPLPPRPTWPTPPGRDWARWVPTALARAASPLPHGYLHTSISLPTLPLRPCVSTVFISNSQAQQMRGRPGCSIRAGTPPGGWVCASGGWPRLRLDRATVLQARWERAPWREGVGGPRLEGGGLALSEVLTRTLCRPFLMTPPVGDWRATPDACYSANRQGGGAVRGPGQTTAPLQHLFSCGLPGPAPSGRQARQSLDGECKTVGAERTGHTNPDAQHRRWGAGLRKRHSPTGGQRQLWGPLFCLRPYLPTLANTQADRSRPELSSTAPSVAPYLPAAARPLPHRASKLLAWSPAVRALQLKPINGWGLHPRTERLAV